MARAAFHDGNDAIRFLSDAFWVNSPSRKVILETCDLLAGRFKKSRPRSHLFSAPRLELWMVRSWECLEDDAFILYLQRFERGLRTNGFGGRFPKALAHAFSEMIENVIRHGSATTSPATGVVGYPGCS